jgi:hypothetical protein
MEQSFSLHGIVNVEAALTRRMTVAVVFALIE